MSLLDNEAVKRSEKALKDFDQSMSVIILSNSGRTANDAASVLKCEVGAIIKSLLFKADSTFILSLVAGDRRCSLNKMKKIIDMNNLSMASPEEVKSKTGYTIGGVSPIGHISSIRILIDNSLNRFVNLYAAAGHPNCVFKISFTNLNKITKGSIKELAE